MSEEFATDIFPRGAIDVYDDDEEDYDDEEAEDASEGAEDDNGEEYEIGDEVESLAGQSQLEAWRDVHTHLVRAVGIAREAVASKKLQRRFWLEEICSNLTEQGRLVTSSVWKRPTAPKRTAKRATKAPGANIAKKRKKKASQTVTTVKNRKPRKKKSDEEKTGEEVKTPPFERDTHDDEEDVDNYEENVSQKTKKIRLKLSKSSVIMEEAATHVEVDLDETSDEDVVEAREVHHEDYQHDDSDGDEGAHDYPTDPIAHSYTPAHHHSGGRSSRMNNSHEFVDGSQWGQQSHDYTQQVGYSPPNYSYHQQKRRDPLPGFFSSSGARHSSLPDQNIYSTYSGPPGNPDDIVSARPPDNGASESEEELPF